MSITPSFFSHQLTFPGRQLRAPLKNQKAHNCNSRSKPTNCEQLSSSNRATHGDLIYQAMKDDPEAQSQLFKVHRTQLYRRAYSILRNREDAEDAVQDCWLRALTNLHSFGGRSSFSTWLTRVVINSALMILRKKRNSREFSFDPLDDSAKLSVLCQLPTNSPNPEESLNEYEEKRILERAICGLRPRIRQVVELGQLQDLSTRETALALGISTAATKGRLFHARAALRKSTALRSIASSRAQSLRFAGNTVFYASRDAKNKKNN